MSNWSSNSDGSGDAGATAPNGADLIFAATSAVGDGNGNLGTTLDQSYSINSLTMATSPLATTPLVDTTIDTAGFTLTIGGGGLTLLDNSANASNLTIADSTSGTGNVALSASQTWTNNHSTAQLLVSVPISSSAASGLTTLSLNSGSGTGGIVLGERSATVPAARTWAW